MITINAMGDECPIPVVKTKKVLDRLQGAEVVEVLVDNEIAVQNLTKLGTSSGGVVSSVKTGDMSFKVIIQLSETDHRGVTQESQSQPVEAENRTNTIVVFSSDKMGEGSEELGKALLKAFIFALTQLEQLPSKMLFYNSGAYLTAGVTESQEDLKKLEAQGVEILTCGTCLDYYDLKDKLAVGSVTNMYSIVEAMNNADKVIKP